MSVTTDLQTTVAGYATALANDSANPQPSYDIDGKKVERNEWRISLEQRIVALNKTINQLNPYIITTKQVL